MSNGNIYDAMKSEYKAHVLKRLFELLPSWHVFLSAQEEKSITAKINQLFEDHTAVLCEFIHHFGVEEFSEALRELVQFSHTNVIPVDCPDGNELFLRARTDNILREFPNMTVRKKEGSKMYYQIHKEGKVFYGHVSTGNVDEAIMALSITFKKPIYKSDGKGGNYIYQMPDSFNEDSLAFAFDQETLDYSSATNTVLYHVDAKAVIFNYINRKALHITHLFKRNSAVIDIINRVSSIKASAPFQDQINTVRDGVRKLISGNCIISLLGRDSGIDEYYTAMRDKVIDESLSHVLQHHSNQLVRSYELAQAAAK